MDDDMTYNPRPSVAKLLAMHQAESATTDNALAETCSLSESAIRLIKDGKMKLPIAAVKKLAAALDESPREVLRTVLNDYQPELHELMENLRMPLDLTKNEQQLLKKYRVLAKGRDASPVAISAIALVFPKSM